MRIMAIDYGDARTGVAVSDALGMIAGETFVIAEWDAEALSKRLVHEAGSRGVGTLVLGLPRNMDGTEGSRAEKARALKALLENDGAPTVVLWDERRTTIDAHRILRENGKKEKKHKNTVDAVAAALILEGYLGTLR